MLDKKCCKTCGLRSYCASRGEIHPPQRIKQENGVPVMVFETCCDIRLLAYVSLHCPQPEDPFGLLYKRIDDEDFDMRNPLSVSAFKHRLRELTK